MVPGLLMPGMVNAHCHLELSHTKGVIEKETGLTSFLQKVNSHNTKEADIDKPKKFKASKQTKWEEDVYLYHSDVQQN